MNVTQAVADLLNKTEPGWRVYAHMIPTRIFRISVKDGDCTFRVEQMTRTNRDNLNPKGDWRTLSTHGSETPGMMLAAAQKAASEAQKHFIKKMQTRMGVKQ